MSQVSCFNQNLKKSMERFQRLMTSPGVVVFGEVGLDCTVTSSDWESQQQILIHLLLNLQMEISDKPTVLPYRESIPLKSGGGPVGHSSERGPVQSADPHPLLPWYPGHSLLLAEGLPQHPHQCWRSCCVGCLGAEGRLGTQSKGPAPPGVGFPICCCHHRSWATTSGTITDKPPLQPDAQFSSWPCPLC